MSPILATILGLLVFILVLSVIVLLHEGGHFLVAKKSGILCHEYAIGMGPAIYQKKIGETVYSIRAIPLGGYVSMAGEEANENMLKGIEKVKVVLDENERVKLISFVLDNPNYLDLETFDVVSGDLIGTENALDDELYLELRRENGDIVRYVVNRDCMINYTKKEEIQNAPYDRRFSNKPYWPRFLSVLAGPLMNFVFALFIFFIMGLCFGYPDASTSTVAEVSGASLTAGLKDNDTLLKIGDHNISNWDEITAVLSDAAHGNVLDEYGYITIDYVSDGDETPKTLKFRPYVYILSAQFLIRGDDAGGVYFDDTASNTWIEDAGYENLSYGDKILKIDGFTMNTVNEVLKYFTDQIGQNQKCKVLYTHDGKELETEFSVYTKDLLEASNYTQTKVLLGISAANKFNFVKCLYMPFVNTGEASTQVLRTLKLLFKKNSGVSLLDLSGPVGIFNLFTQLVQGEDAIYNILYWTGLLSVNIGLMNLLPLPALDGGRLAFMIYEGITKKKPTPKVENTIHNIGFILLMALFVVIFISDMIKCF